MRSVPAYAKKIIGTKILGTYGTINSMRKVRKGVGLFLAALAALAAVAAVQSYLYPLTLSVRNDLLLLVGNSDKNLAVIDHLYDLARIGGFAMTALAAVTTYIIASSLIRSMFVTKKVLAYEQWFQELYENAPTPYLLIRSNYTMTQPNKAAMRLFGASSDVFSMISVKDVIAKGDLERFKGFMNRFTHGLSVASEPIRITGKNKEIRWTLFSILARDHRLVGIREGLATFVDITEQKRLEHALRIQVIETRKFARAVESTIDGVVITDPSLAVIYVNHAWEQLTGYSADEIRGKKVGLLQSDKTPQPVVDNMAQAVATLQPFKSDNVIHKRKDGREYYADIELFPIVDNEREGAAFYVQVERDVSKQKEIDRAKTEFVSLTSHQLRTPLLTQQWYTEMLLSGDAGALAEKQTEYVGKINRGVQNLVSLVNLFLDISKIEMGSLPVKPETTNPLALAREVLEELTPDIQKKEIAIDAETGGAPRELTTDRHLLRVILQNLFSNAVKYTPERGAIHITIGTEKKNLKVVVADTGCGIPTEQQEKIFTKLFRADNATQSSAHGFGLGLYMTKSITETLGGTISFTSVLNQGTTFTVLLPLSYTAPQKATKPT